MRGKSIKNTVENNVIRFLDNRVLEINPENISYATEIIPQLEIKARVYKFKFKKHLKEPLADKN